MSDSERNSAAVISTSNPAPGRRRPPIRAARTAFLALLAAIALVLSACAGSGGPEKAEATGNGDVARDVSGTCLLYTSPSPRDRS